jgi:hypothetical protein
MTGLPAGRAMRHAAHGPIAQRLEQGTHNPLVPGSNPGGPTKNLFDGIRVA